jgi:hypothetical protein
MRLNGRKSLSMVDRYADDVTDQRALSRSKVSPVTIPAFRCT